MRKGNLYFVLIWRYFHWIGPLGRFSHRRIAMSVCLSVCLRPCKTPTFGCCGDFWLKNIFLILVCDDKIVKNSACSFFSRLLKCAVLDHSPHFVSFIYVGKHFYVCKGGARKCMQRRCQKMGSY